MSSLWDADKWVLSFDPKKQWYGNVIIPDPVISSSLIRFRWSWSGIVQWFHAMTCDSFTATTVPARACTLSSALNAYYVVSCNLSVNPLFNRNVGNAFHIQRSESLNKHNHWAYGSELSNLPNFLAVSIPSIQYARSAHAIAGSGFAGLNAA